jgi:hypothetical protein
LLLIAGIAVKRAACATGSSSDRSAFKSAAGLVTDDSAKCCPTQATQNGTALGVRAGRGRAVGKSDCRNGTGDGDECWFHGKTGIGCNLIGVGGPFKGSIEAAERTRLEGEIFKLFIKFKSAGSGRHLDGRSNRCLLL